MRAGFEVDLLPRAPGADDQFHRLGRRDVREGDAHPRLAREADELFDRLDLGQFGPRERVIFEAGLALGPELFDQALDHVVVFGVDGQDQARFRNGREAVEDRAVVGHREAAELLVAPLGRLVKKRLERDDALFGHASDLVRELRPGRAEERVVHQRLRGRRILALLQDLRRIGGRAGDRVLQERRHARARAGHALGHERPALSVPRIADVHVRVHHAGKDRLATRVQLFPSGREKAFVADRDDLSAVDRQPARNQFSVRIHLCVAYDKINRVHDFSSVPPRPRQMRGFNSYIPRSPTHTRRSDGAIAPTRAPSRRRNRSNRRISRAPTSQARVRQPRVRRRAAPFHAPS